MEEFNDEWICVDGIDDWFVVSIGFINPPFGRSLGGGDGSLPVDVVPSFFRRCFLKEKKNNNIYIYMKKTYLRKNGA